MCLALGPVKHRATLNEDSKRTVLQYCSLPWDRVDKGWSNTAMSTKTENWIALWAWKSPKIGHNPWAKTDKKNQRIYHGAAIGHDWNRFWAFSDSKNEPIHAVSSRHSSVESTWILSILPKYDMWESDNAHKLTPVIPANLFQGWKFRLKARYDFKTD